MNSLAAALRVQAQTRAVASAKERKRQPWPRPRYPALEALHYYRLLRYWVEVVQYIVKRDIVPLLPDLLAATTTTQPQPRKDATGKDIDAAFDQALAEAQETLPDGEIVRGVQQTALRVTEWNAGELNKQVQRVAKINLYDNTTGLAEHMELFVADNVKLVKSLAFGQLGDLHGVVSRGARAGLHHTEVAKQIVNQFGVTKRRAAVIARDQIGKLNGELNQLRQTNLGVRRYRWSTSLDARVRDNHRSLEGSIQEWKHPPVVDQRTGERGHPGQPIMCRCSAIPIIDDVLAEAGLLDPDEIEIDQPAPGEQPPLRMKTLRPAPSPRPPTQPPPPPPVRPPPPMPLPKPPTSAFSDDEALVAQAREQVRQMRAAASKRAREAKRSAKAQAGIDEALRLSEAERAAVVEAERAAALEAERQAAEEFQRAVRRAKPKPPKPPKPPAVKRKPPGRR